MKRFLSAFMASIMLMLVITGSAAMAATNEVQQESTFELSRELIDKANPFVKLQSQKFTLSEDASQNLTVGEVELVNKALNLANEQAKNIQGNDVTVTETPHNSLKVAPSTFSTAAINTSSYWDYELLWWGYRIFLSNDLIEDIKSRSLAIGGVSALTSGTLNAILTSIGLPGWIANIVVGVFLIKGATIVYADRGRGVYIDAFWAADPASQILNFALSKVYAA